MILQQGEEVTKIFMSSFHQQKLIANCIGQKYRREKYKFIKILFFLVFTSKGAVNQQCTERYNKKLLQINRNERKEKKNSRSI